MKISIISPSIRPQGLVVVRESLLKQGFKDFEWIVDINWTGESDLNASLNRCIKRSQGELIVFLQDYIEIEPDGLQLFWDAYTKNPNVLFTAPVGKKGETEEINWDWRKHHGSKITWMEWEIDWGACAKSILYEVGGFDERLDEGWGFDNVNLALRAHLKNHSFINIQKNLAVAFDHDAYMKHPFKNKRDPLQHNYLLDQIRMGEIVNCLK